MEESIVAKPKGRDWGAPKQPITPGSPQPPGKDWGQQAGPSGPIDPPPESEHSKALNSDPNKDAGEPAIPEPVLDAGPACTQAEALEPAIVAGETHPADSAVDAACHQFNGLVAAAIQALPEQMPLDVRNGVKSRIANASELIRIWTRTRKRL